MRRALVLLNLYGCEAVWHKLKNTLKTPKIHFLPVLEHMSDSLTAIQIEPYQCPSHQSILLTQGPIHEIFMKKYLELAELKNEVFVSRPFEFFFSKWPPKKNLFFKITNSRNFSAKISWIGPWVSRIDWCEGHWFGSTYTAVRLSDIRPKTGEKWIFGVF